MDLCKGRGKGLCVSGPGSEEPRMLSFLGYRDMPDTQEAEAIVLPSRDL